MLVPSDKVYLLKDVNIFRLANTSKAFSLIISYHVNDFVSKNLNFSELTILEKSSIAINLTRGEVQGGVLIDSSFYKFVSTENGLGFAPDSLSLTPPAIVDLQKVGEEYINYILKEFDPQTELTGMLNTNNEWAITANEVPQFSAWGDVIYRTIDVLYKAGDYAPTFEKMGYFLRGKASEVALKKYGENHAKCCEMLDLTAITPTRPRQVHLTVLGKRYYKLENKEKNKVILHQILRMPLMREIIAMSNKPDFCVKNYLMSKGLSEKTSIRRKPNIKTMMQFLYENGLFPVIDIIEKF